MPYGKLFIVTKLGRGCWTVFYDGADQAEIYRNKKEALDRARELLRMFGRGDIYVQRAEAFSSRELDPAPHAYKAWNGENAPSARP